jgi:hypothetical protein
VSTTKTEKNSEEITGVVPCPAVLAPGDEVAKVMAKPPFSLLIMKEGCQQRGFIFSLVFLNLLL